MVLNGFQNNQTIIKTLHLCLYLCICICKPYENNYPNACNVVQYYSCIIFYIKVLGKPLIMLQAYITVALSCIDWFNKFQLVYAYILMQNIFQVPASALIYREQYLICKCRSLKIYRDKNYAFGTNKINLTFCI